MLLTSLITAALLAGQASADLNHAAAKAAARQQLSNRQIAEKIIAASTKVSSADVTKVAVAAADDAYGTPNPGDMGFVNLATYFEGGCAGEATMNSQVFGTCISSEDSTGTANSFKVVYNSVVGTTYTFTQTEYSSTTCTNAQQSTTYTFTTGSCNTQESAKFVSVTSDYTPVTGSYNTMINYASAATCSAGDYTDVISAISFPTGMCFDMSSTDDNAYGDDYFSSASVKYGCNKFSYFPNSDCSGSAAFSGPLGSTGCALNADDDDDDGDDDDFDDDNYNAVEYTQWSCQSAASGSLAASAGLVLGAASVALSFLW